MGREAGSARRSRRRSRVDRRVRPLYKPPARCGFSALGYAQVAQLVEHATENRSVGGSIPPLGTSFDTTRNRTANSACEIRCCDPHAFRRRWVVQSLPQNDRRSVFLGGSWVVSVSSPSTRSMTRRALTSRSRARQAHGISGSCRRMVARRRQAELPRRRDASCWL